MNAKEILNQFREANQPSVDRTTQEMLSERLISETYKVDGNKDLLDSSLHWSIRASIAQQTLQKIIIKQTRSIEAVLPNGPQITRAESAENIKTLLLDPRLTKEQREALMDAAWFVAAAPDELDQEKIESDLKKQKLSAVANKLGSQSQDSVSAEYGRLKKKLEREGVNGDELHEARKQMTLEYLERVANDEEAKRDLTNSRKNLHALELDIAFARKNSKKLSDEEMAGALGGVVAGVGAVSQIAATGGARQLYGKISQQSEAKIAKMAGKLVGKVAGEAASGAANVILPGSGFVVGKVVGKTAEFVTDKSVGFLLRNKGKIAKGAAVVLALPFILVGGTVAVVGAGLAAAGAGLVATGIVLPIILAFTIFIINTGAYIVPPSVGVSTTNPEVPEPGSEAPVGLGDCPTEGPAGWPVTTDRGMYYYVAQGPFTPGPNKWSHYGLEAIDVSYEGIANLNKQAIATHPGTVASVGIDSWGGAYVDLRGTCNGGKFRSRHVHMYWTTVTDEQTVVRGTKLGPVGDTGHATGKHDHYEFRAIDRFGSTTFANSPLPMAPPYIPKVVPRGCVQGATDAPPCDVRVP
jgi:hypothetical protein